jgi:hypothetical protein
VWVVASTGQKVGIGAGAIGALVLLWRALKPTPPRPRPVDYGNGTSHPDVAGFAQAALPAAMEIALAYPNLSPTDGAAIALAHFTLENGWVWPPPSLNPMETSLPHAVGALVQTSADRLSHWFDTLEHGLAANLETLQESRYGAVIGQGRLGFDPEGVIDAVGPVWLSKRLPSGELDTAANLEYAATWWENYQTILPYLET